MREVRHLRVPDARIRPWKNGLGSTSELAIEPPGANFEEGAFHWRVSTSRVVSPGPFSAFPGYDRVLVATSGPGLVLSHGESAARARLRCLEPYAFRGEWVTAADLIAGPVDDFNVFTRRGRVRAQVQVWRLGERRLREALGAPDALLHAVHGRARVRVSGEEEPFELAPGESLRLSSVRVADELDLQGLDAHSALILVGLEATGG